MRATRRRSCSQKRNNVARAPPPAAFAFSHPHLGRGLAGCRDSWVPGCPQLSLIFVLGYGSISGCPVLSRSVRKAGHCLLECCDPALVMHPETKRCGDGRPRPSSLKLDSSRLPTYTNPSRLIAFRDFAELQSDAQLQADMLDRLHNINQGGAISVLES